MKPLPSPGASKPGASLDLERPTDTEGSEGAGSCLTYNPHMNLSLTQQRQRLPIFKVRCAPLLLLAAVSMATSPQLVSEPNPVSPGEVQNCCHRWRDRQWEDHSGILP